MWKYRPGAAAFFTAVTVALAGCEAQKSIRLSVHLLPVPSPGSASPRQNWSSRRRDSNTRNHNNPSSWCLKTRPPTASVRSPTCSRSRQIRLSRRRSMLGAASRRATTIERASRSIVSIWAFLLLACEGRRRCEFERVLFIAIRTPAEAGLESAGARIASQRRQGQFSPTDVHGEQLRSERRRGCGVGTNSRSRPTRRSRRSWPPASRTNRRDRRHLRPARISARISSTIGAREPATAIRRARGRTRRRSGRPPRRRARHRRLRRIQARGPERVRPITARRLSTASPPSIRSISLPACHSVNASRT